MPIMANIQMLNSSPGNWVELHSISQSESIICMQYNSCEERLGYGCAERVGMIVGVDLFGNACLEGIAGAIWACPLRPSSCRDGPISGLRWHLLSRPRSLSDYDRSRSWCTTDNHRCTRRNRPRSGNWRSGNSFLCTASPSHRIPLKQPKHIFIYIHIHI